MAKGKYAEWLKEDSLILLRKWARDGCTDEEIAKRMGITTSTFYEWKNKYSEISEALKKTKAIVDAEFEASVLATCQEHTVKERVKKWAKNKDTGEMELIFEQENERVIPTNAILSCFILKNRMNGQYRDKQEYSVEMPKPKVTSGAESLED